MLLKTEYSHEEISKLSEKDLEQLLNEPGWVIKSGKIVKVSDEEYQQALKDTKGTEDRYTGVTI